MSIQHKNIMQSKVSLLFLFVCALLAACSSNSLSSTQGMAVHTITNSTAAKAPSMNVALTSIRMLDHTQGWALTTSAILKTADGGLHWRNVSPANAITTPISGADFMDMNNAWITTSPIANQSTQTGIIRVLFTTDGGVHWQSSIIHDIQAVGVDRPHFINRRLGWLLVGTGAAMSHESVDIFQSVDGGLTWNRIATTDIMHTPPHNGALSFEGDKTGISFKDALTGWAAATTPATDAPWLYVTHDGGKTWLSQSLPLLKGVSNAEYNTTPPVFFGNAGLLPVQVDTATTRGIDLYVTHNGGASWTPTPLTSFSSLNTYVLDMQHVYASDEKSFYATNDASITWTKLAAIPVPLLELSFVDPATGWAIGTTDAQPPVLLHTTNGGRSWQQLNYSIQ